MMAAGRWNHTAAIVASQINLGRMIQGLMGLPQPFISELDVHPYKRVDKDVSDLVKALQRIAKLPFAERKTARDEVLNEFEQRKRS